MSRGIYIVANDKVTEQAIALLNSIRFYDPDVPVVMIPYDETYQQVAHLLGDKFGLTVYEDLDFIKRLSQKLQDIFGSQFFARPNQFRKQACWFGPFDEFLYIDTDIVVFEKIIDNLNYLQDQDFICCDYQYAGGITNVFTPKVIENQVFTPEELKSIFNGGFWASKKGLLSEQDLYDTFAECAAHPEYFDFSQKTSDQPIINYMILKRVKRRFNIVHRPEMAAGNWAGTKKFQPIEGYKLFDPDNRQPLQYLHWAGIRIQPGCPYWKIWEHYRYLNEPKPSFSEPKAEKKSFLNSLGDRLRKIKAKLGV